MQIRRELYDGEGNIIKSDYVEVDARAASALIKAEAARRIEEHYPVWKQLNIVRAGGDALNVMSAFIDRVREVSDDLEASMPGDYADDKNWPKNPE